MYEQVSTQKTYAWITDTANSNPINATKIANGINVNAATKIPALNN